MPLYKETPVANGLRTDHPVPDLPFVDDSHIPLDDPHAIEAIGRHHGTGTWGRTDPVSQQDGGGWVAFTTDSLRKDLAWLVRWHPDHGRSVLLYRDEEVVGAYMGYVERALLFRAGGYWWDGSQWYRPSQIYITGEDYQARTVPAAVTVTAAGLLDSTSAKPEQGRLLGIQELDLEVAAGGRWTNDLAMWAEDRTDGEGLADCVVTLTAPELTVDQLVGIPGLAELGDIAASTLRAYISRDEADVPTPQARINGRDVWSRPVAEEWAESRQRSDDAVIASVSAERNGASLAIGLADLWTWFSRVFAGELWERPTMRKRWALRWRNKVAVQQLADELGWLVAVSLSRHVPMSDLGITIRHAILDDFTTQKELADDWKVGEDEPYYGIGRPITEMLDWLIRHDPATARYTVGETVAEATRRGISRSRAEHSIRTALGLDSRLDHKTREDFLRRVFAPREE